MVEQTERLLMSERGLIEPFRFIIDLDRTLVDPNKAMERFGEAWKRSSLGSEMLIRIGTDREAAEKKGESFDPFSYVPYDNKNEFILRFLDTKNEPILYGDAVRFLRRLARKGLGYTVLTYGLNPEWQGLKLKASGCGGTGIIIDTKYKSLYLAKRRNPKGYFELDNGDHHLVREVLLVDDNPLAFMSSDNSSEMTAGVRGYLVNRDPRRLDGKVIPDGVIVVSSLDQLLLTDSGFKVKSTKSGK